MNSLDAVLKFRKENNLSEKTVKRLNDLLLKALKAEKLSDLPYYVIKNFFDRIINSNDSVMEKDKPRKVVIELKKCF